MRSYRDTVYDNLNLKETDELLDIWRKNNKEEWSETALEVVRDILIERLGKLPEIFPVETSEIIDDLNTREDVPEFYNPVEVRKLIKWFRYIPLVIICLVELRVLSAFENFYSTAIALFWKSQLVTIVATILFIAIELAFSFILYYFPMKALGNMLQIIFQMENNSRPKTQVTLPVVISDEE